MALSSCSLTSQESGPVPALQADEVLSAVETAAQATSQAGEPAVQATSQPTEAAIEPSSTPLPGGFCQPDALAAGFWITGYLPEYQPVNQEMGNCLTDLIFFSLEPTSHGHLDASRLSGERLDELHAIQTRYGLRLHLSLGGWGRNGGFGPMVIDPVLRQGFVLELSNFLQQNGFNGVDFDWEFPESDGEVSGYGSLIKETVEALSAWGGQVTVTFYPYENLDLEPFLSADRIHIMSYDRGSQHATYEQAEADIKLFLQLGAPPEKLVLGIPFYGREMSEPYTAYTYAQIVDQYKPEPGQDEAGGVYFNGIETVQLKTCLARQQGLGGVMIWEIGQDVQPGSGLEQYSLLQAINAALKDGCSP